MRERMKETVGMRDVVAEEKLEEEEREFEEEDEEEGGEGRRGVAGERVCEGGGMG